MARFVGGTSLYFLSPVVEGQPSIFHHAPYSSDVCAENGIYYKLPA